MIEYRRVIAILPERLGDALFHTPALRTVKLLQPDIHLAVIALSPLCAEVLQNNPYVDAVYVLPNKNAVYALRARYDATLLLHTHDLAKQYAEWLALPTFSIPPTTKPTHWSQHSFEFACSLGGGDPAALSNRYDLFPDAANANKIRALLQNAGFQKNDILIGCHIGCHSIAKRGLKWWRALAHPKVWPFDNFVELEATLRAIEPRVRFVLTGSQGEARLGKKFAKLAPRSINLIDRTSVLDLAALMDCLTLFITPDTGAMHVACARDVGIVALFGPTQLEVTGPHPRRDNYRILQQQNLADLSVADVMSTIIAHPDFVRART